MQQSCASARIGKGHGEKKISNTDQVRRNEFIGAPELRVIDAEGQQIGVMSKDEALAQARNLGLDLVEVSPQAKPPVAKIVDWNKYRYQKTKQDKKNRLKSRADLKEIRLGLKIGQHDLDIKLRKTREFLERGHNVRITARFRGREMAHRELGFELLKKVVKLLEDTAVVDQEPRMAGRQVSMIIRSKPGAKDKNP